MMKKFLKIIVASIVFVFLFVFIFYAFNYIKYQTADYYLLEKEQLYFNDIFYHNKEDEIYGIGLFDYFDAVELQESPETISDYDSMGRKIFKVDTIKDLFGMLKKCSFSPMTKKDAYKILWELKDENVITSIHISTNVFYPDNPWFSKDVLDAVNAQVVGVVDATIYFYNGEGYLVANMATFSEYYEFYKYEMPCFTDTILTVLKIENSAEFNEILDRKSEFYVFEPEFYEHINQSIRRRIFD